MSETETEPLEAAEEDEAGDGADTEEPEPIEGPETEAAAPPADPSSQAKLEKASRENVRYLKALERILGPDPTRHECAACQGMAIVWGEPELEPEIPYADDTEACSVCNATGFQRTHSRNPDHAGRPCGTCGGRGWVQVVATPPPAPLYAAPAEAQAAQLQGTYVPGRGFIPYGATEPIPGSA